MAGHRVALMGANTIEYVVAYFAALRAGCVVVPMNPTSTLDEVAAMVHHSGARVMITDRLDDPDQIAGLTADFGTVELTPDGLASAVELPVSSPRDSEALAVLLYTAGTSGDPKAAMLSHRALLAHCAQIGSLAVVGESDIWLSVLPLFHVFGLNAVLGVAAAAGARLVIMDGFVGDVLKVIRAERVTNLPLVPSAIYRLLHDDRLATGLSGVRTVLSGAASLPVTLGGEFTSRTGLRVEQGYGLTEAAPGVSTTIGGEILGAGHVGRPLPGVEVRIGDGEDDSEPAEIWIRGNNLFSGYWPDGAGGVDDDGWFATGDIGYLLLDGELFLVDRTRELIIVSGFNVYPVEVEEVITELPSVEAAAVVGQPESATQELVVAFVVGTQVTEAAIRDHLSSRLARFKQPAEIHFVDELPRGATGKIRKGALRELLAAKRELLGAERELLEAGDK